MPGTPSSTLFPYTTLFRSSRSWRVFESRPAASIAHAADNQEPRAASSTEKRSRRQPRAPGCPQRGRRSEEHTSELQSRFDLVCRLLLEKKKIALTSYAPTE